MVAMEKNQKHSLLLEKKKTSTAYVSKKITELYVNDFPYPFNQFFHPSAFSLSNIIYGWQQ